MQVAQSARGPEIPAVRPQRRDAPFDPAMTGNDVALLLSCPEIAAIRADRFPENRPLIDILANDTRVARYRAGEIVVRQGDYGNSAFLLLEGSLRVVLGAGLPAHVLGHEEVAKRSSLSTLWQLWRSSHVPEVRRRTGDNQGPGEAVRVFLQDIPAILDEHRTATLADGAMFGELAALGRVPHAATVFAETDAVLLEIRWQGLREIRRYDDGFRRAIDERYRANALIAHLRETGLFEGLPEEELQEVGDHVLFETYGSFDWNVSYQQQRRRGEQGARTEPTVAHQGDYPDGLLLIRAGFARESVRFGLGERTLTYKGAGDHFGFTELYRSWLTGNVVPFDTSLTALGYVDVLRVPTHVLETYVFPKVTTPVARRHPALAMPLTDAAALEWAVNERFINGTEAMLIDLDRCTRCDDCVRACADAHDGNPRFIRHGKTFDHWMVANACMHCADPVCMIGCPTGAIHRSEQCGTVIINDDACIGCATCANACPYNNIRMVEVKDRLGAAITDAGTGQPVTRATKCDLCAARPGEPACVTACAHDALRRVSFEDGTIFEGFVK
jgi:Fe-S-cluster-containing dehydrogenase component/CRP-like cAMP-binding protein